MKPLLLLLVLCLSAGCAAMPVQRYAAEQPPLRLQEYFDGELTAWGMFQDRRGQVLRRFTVHIEARWQDGIGVLDERFRYDDGSEERRVWTLRELGGGRFEGTAADVHGQARGVLAGNALNLRYQLILSVGDRKWRVTMDDWMYLIDERTLVNRTRMSKFGIHLGDVTLFFRKETPP
jgi:hypothetical protein